MMTQKLKLKKFKKQPLSEFDFFLLSRTGQRHQDRLLTSGDTVENEVTEVTRRLITDHFKTSDPLKLWATHLSLTGVMLLSHFNRFAITRKRKLINLVL